ncbi:Anaphase-promoting complex subunit 4 [Actinomortierella wolfii]|nr:Anaphase-promoting complex subunit 4 [Actinomortierella wolfii]
MADSLSLGRPSYRLYTEKKLASAHKLQAWCPTADLLALVTVQNELVLYRLSWQKHWVLPSPSKQKYGSKANPRLKHSDDAVEIISLAWRPDGKAIAVGLNTGFVIVHDYRDGSILHSVPSDQTSGAMQRITCLQWEDLYFGPPSQNSLFGSQAQGESILKYMPLLSQIPITMQQQQQILRARLMNRNKNPKEEDPTTKALAQASATIEPLDEESGEAMNVLVAGDDEGNIRLGLFGAFDLPVISLSEHIKTTFPDISTKKLDKVVQLTVDLGLLYRCRKEARSIGLKKAPVLHLLNYLKESLAAMESEYKRVLHYSEDCIDTIEQSLSDHGVTSSPALEFTRLLLTGVASPSIDQYIQRELGHEGIIQWDRGARSAFGTVRKIAFENLIPACERLMIHLTDILGYSQWEERFAPLAIREQNVYACIKAVGDFMGILEDLFRCVKEQQTLFLEFKNWLDQVLDLLQNTNRSNDDLAPEEQKRFPPVDTLRVVEYINSGLISDPVQKFFKRDEDDSTPEQQRTPEPVQLVPQYPVVYSFTSETIRPEAKALDPKYRVPDIELETDTSITPYPETRAKAHGAGLQRAKTMVLSKGPSSLSRSSTKSFLKSPPVSGSLPSLGSSSKRTMTMMPPPSAPRTSRTTATQTAHSTELNPGNTNKPPTTASTVSKLTIREQLKIMTDHCLKLFQVSEMAIANSISVTQCVFVRVMDTSEIDANEKESKGTLKIATRYCDMGEEAWHYTAVYQQPTSSFPDGAVCIFRKRHEAPRLASFTPHISLSAPTGQLSPGIASKKRKLDGGTSEPLKRATTSSSGFRMVSGTATRSPSTPLTPRIERLSLQSPVPSSTSHSPSSRSPSSPPGDPSAARTGAGNPLEIQALVYSLHDGGTQDAGNPSASESSPSSYIVRDMLFLDDYTLGLLLSSDRLQQQYVVSVPIPVDDDSDRGMEFSQVTERRPRFRALDESAIKAACQTRPLIETILSSCMQHESYSPSSSSSLSPAAHHGSNPWTMFPLPITRSRCVTHYGGSGGERGGFSAETRAGPPHDTIPSQSVSSKVAAATPADFEGPVALASNEREHRRVLSVHGAAENVVVGGASRTDGNLPKSLTMSTMGRHIAVFELDGEYYHPT